MSARDVLLTLGILSTLPVCLLRPWVGILVWSWLAFMNPHRLTWGFAHGMPFAQLVGVVTLVGFVFARDRKPFLIGRETLLLLALWGWFALTTMQAMYPEMAWLKFTEVSKILLMALLAVPLFQDRRKLRILILVIAMSLGFYGFKGGIFVLTSGGGSMVLGPPDSFFAANTELALALNMAAPLLVYLAREEPRRWLRYLLWAMFGLTVLAVPFTYSRGGFIGLVVVLLFLFVKARRRVLLVPVIALLVVAFSMFTPERWVSRMQTLENVEEDGSAQLRMMSWRVALGIVGDRPIFGGGFLVFVDRATYDIYMPNYPRAFGHDAHSIYFNLIGEHGWVGFGLFFTLIGVTVLRLRELRRMARAHPQVQWAANYADMLQASIATYLTTGAFLSVAYFDLTYQLLILVPVIYEVARKEVEAQAAVPATTLPVPVAVPAGRPS